MEPLFEELRARLQEQPGRPLDAAWLDLREAAVVAPLAMRQGCPILVFTRRPDTLRRHAGQISFPGGVRDPGDSTPLQAALRELEEEVGVARDQVDVLGMLDELPTLTEFRVVPFVGLLGPRVELRPDPEEIAEVIEVPVAALMEPSRQRIERRMIRGQERDIHFFEHAGHTIWGATARIVRNLLDLTADLPAWRALSKP